MSWDPHASSSDSEEDDDFNRSEGREAYIFAIDALLFKNDDRFERCLECIREAFLNGVLTRGNDLIGIVFNNTVNSPPPKDISGMENIVPHQNTAVFIPLRQLSKETVDYYLSFLGSSDHFDFENKYGCAAGNFANMVWLCTNMFQQCGYKLSTTLIAYFTDLDTPHDVANSDFQKAIRKAKDLQEISVDFQVIPMRDEFDYTLFYKEFSCTVRNIQLDEFISEEPKKSRALIANRMFRQNCKARCTVHLRWKIGVGVQLAVGVYNFYKKNVYPSSIKMLREDSSVVDVKHVYKIAPIAVGAGESGDERYCLPSEQRKLITVGGEKIYFTNEEVHQMKYPMAPGLRLLGFKPRSTIQQHNFLKSAAYLYPNEEAVTGSTKLFRALWEKCLEKGKVAISIIVLKRNSSPQYVALIPTEKNDLELHKNLCSEGFHIWYLPYQTDIRKIDFSDRNNYEDDQNDIDLITKLTKKLKIKYAPEQFKDPSLNVLRANIVDVAFNIETQDNVDLNSLDSLGIDEERFNQVVASFANQLELIVPDPQSENSSNKRKRVPNDAQGSKIARIENPLSREDIQRYIENNTLDILTVKTLKTYLLANNVSGLGNATKSVLITKVNQLHSSE